jgi:hypothetical protein
MGTPRRLDKQSVLRALVDAHRDELRVSQENIKRFRGSSVFPDASSGAAEEVNTLEALLSRYFPSVMQTTAVPGTHQDGSIVVTERRFADVPGIGRYEYYLVLSQSQIRALAADRTRPPIQIVTPHFFEVKKIGERFTTVTGRPGEQFKEIHTLVDVY